MTKSSQKKPTHRRFNVRATVRRRSGKSGDARRVGRLFGLRANRERLWDNQLVDIAAGEVVAVVGPSGAGKSVLLRSVARHVADAVVLDAGKPARSGKPAVRFVGSGPLSERLEILSRCGLAEAAVLAGRASELSAGQQWRLALARALHQGRSRGPGMLVVADEFASGLDATTAAVLARQVRSLINPSSPGAPALLLATPRSDLLHQLRPDRTIVKPLGERPRMLGRFRRLFASGEPPWGRFRISRGRIADYDALSRWHYLAGRPATHKRVWVVRTSRRAPESPEIAAVMVVSPPTMRCRGRNAALPGRYTGPDNRKALALLNAEIECVSRVVVHPMYRGCSLATALVRHALATAATPLVEALAVMGGIHPLFTRAGMAHVGRFKGSRRYHYFLAPRLPAPLCGDPSPAGEDMELAPHA
ncbi:MAG: ATP-binding cassette domain-containing protein [Phycisphaerae bacterium]